VKNFPQAADARAPAAASQRPPTTAERNAIVSHVTDPVAPDGLQLLSRAHLGVVAAILSGTRRARPLLKPCAVLSTRPVWTRGLTLLETPAPCRLTIDPDDDALVAVQSWFRSVDDPRRLARYSVAETTRRASAPGSDHTLLVVREFRRVPLLASSLALTVFVARPGQVAPVIATLALFAERAVSLFQPSYLLLARSLEQPPVAVVVTGVHDEAALRAARGTAFTFEGLLPELSPMLAREPEHYVYDAGARFSGVTSLVSPHAI
jgi:hypothetical protein